MMLSILTLLPSLFATHKTPNALQAQTMTGVVFFVFF
jgi:hypothetical protein